MGNCTSSTATGEEPHGRSNRQATANTSHHLGQLPHSGIAASGNEALSASLRQDSSRISVDNFDARVQRREIDPETIELGQKIGEGMRCAEILLTVQAWP